MYRIVIGELIDSLIFQPLGLFGIKNRIREGCQKCIGLKLENLPILLFSYQFGPPERFRSQKWDSRGVPDMYRIVIGKPIDSLIFLPFGLPELFRSQKLDPRRVPEMYRIVIGKPIDSLIFLPFGLPEAYRNGKSNPRGMPGVERERGS